MSEKVRNIYNLTELLERFSHRRECLLWFPPNMRENYYFCTSFGEILYACPSLFKTKNIGYVAACIERHVEIAAQDYALPFPLCSYFVDAFHCFMQMI